MLRSARERIAQTVLFEIGGFALTAPLYSLYAGEGGDEAAMVVAALALAVMVWSPLHNTIFDVIDLRLTGRVASDRPHGWRVVHAISHEATSIVITTPILMWLGGHGLAEALALDLAFTAAYAAWAYVFNLLYDRWRPVRREEFRP
jgi:uncharacterized membrane protein